VPCMIVHFGGQGLRHSRLCGRCMYYSCCLLPASVLRTRSGCCLPACAADASHRLRCCCCCCCCCQVWEVQWGRDGYKGTPKVMDLKGHKSQVRVHAVLLLLLTAAPDVDSSAHVGICRHHGQLCSINAPQSLPYICHLQHYAWCLHGIFTVALPLLLCCHCR
jgi:hypothetical protein